MSIRRNVLANYIGDIYMTVIAIVMVPAYMRYIGAEAYGLVGFFSMLLAWFQLLDMGLTPTMARETARFHGGANDGMSLRRLLRALEGVFIAIAIIGCASLIAGSGALAAGWLKVQQLSLSEVRDSIALMAFIVALRWMGGLYRGALGGFQVQVWLSGFNIAATTARYVLVLPFFILVSTRPAAFFLYQAGLAVLELVVLVAKTYSLMPPLAGRRLAWEWGPLRGVLKFSLGVAFSHLVWVCVTQTDKLLLSKLLPLADYGTFTLVVLVAAGVLNLSGPISNALMPRMATLHAGGDEEGMMRLYSNATQFAGILTIGATMVLMFFGSRVLWAWIGNADIAARAAPVMALYAAGYGIRVLAYFPYYLQYARGDLKMHLIGHGLFLAYLVPALYVGALHAGAIGAGIAWCSANALYMLAWVPVVHARHFKGRHLGWLMRDIAPVAGATLALSLLIWRFFPWPPQRLQTGLCVALISVMMLAAGAMASPWARASLAAMARARGYLVGRPG
ncbi:MAG: oligosaccharide flippase family protein [Pseudomonadota bacterium]